MAKSEPKTSAAKPEDETPVSERETEPVIEAPPSTLPAGVQMHDTGKPVYAQRDAPTERDPSKPPAGWKGSFSRCGGCGDFLGNNDRCPKCAPAGAGAPCFVNHPTVIA